MDLFRSQMNSIKDPPDPFVVMMSQKDKILNISVLRIVSSWETSAWWMRWPNISNQRDRHDCLQQRCEILTFCGGNFSGAAGPARST